MYANRNIKMTICRRRPKPGVMTQNVELFLSMYYVGVFTFE